MTELCEKARLRFFHPFGVRLSFLFLTHGLRRGLHSFAALRLMGHAPPRLEATPVSAALRHEWNSCPSRSADARFKTSSMWSILWNGFHICKSFKSCWIKSFYMPPTKPRSALNETVPLWCAMPCGNISAGWNCGPMRSATARVTCDNRKPTQKRGAGKRRVCGRKSSPR